MAIHKERGYQYVPTGDNYDPTGTGTFYAPLYERRRIATDAPGESYSEDDVGLSYSDWMRENEFGRTDFDASHDDQAVRAKKKRRREHVSHPPRDPRRQQQTYDDDAGDSSSHDELASNLGPPTCEYERRVVDPIELELEAKRASAERDVLFCLLEGILESADSHVQALAFKPKYERITDAERTWVKTKYDIEEVFQDIEHDTEEDSSMIDLEEELTELDGQ